MTGGPALAPCAVRLLQPEDSQVVRELFREVFNDTMSDALWRWKYAHARGHGVLVFRNDQLVCHYGGIGRDILYFGEPRTAVQITDVMVKPAQRKAVRNNSPFFLAGKRFLEQYIGFDNPYLLGFGFPSDRHMRLAGLLKLYAPVGHMMRCSWALPDSRGAMPRWWQAIPVNGENVDQYRGSLDQVWQAMAACLGGGIVGLKDSTYLQQRYLGHPGQHYRIFLLRQRFTRRPRGIIVLKQENGKAMLMDIIGPFSILKQLLGAALALAQRGGGTTLETWCSAAYSASFQVAACRQQELPITTPANIWTPGPAPEQLYNKWWLMPGDTDFL